MVDADHGAEQTDERSRRTHRCEEREALTKTSADRALAARQAVRHPIVLVDRVGELAVLILGKKGIIDDRAIGAPSLSFVAASRRLGEFQSLLGPCGPG